jgi:hypothetical protein
VRSSSKSKEGSEKIRAESTITGYMDSHFEAKRVAKSKRKKPNFSTIDNDTVSASTSVTLYYLYTTAKLDRLLQEI